MKHYKISIVVLLLLIIVNASWAQSNSGYTITLNIDKLKVINLQEDRIMSDGDEIYVIYQIFPKDRLGNVLEPSIHTEGILKYTKNRSVTNFEPLSLYVPDVRNGFYVLISVYEQDQEQLFSELSDSVDDFRKNLEAEMRKSGSREMVLSAAQFLSLPDPLMVLRGASFSSELASLLFADDHLGDAWLNAEFNDDVSEIMTNGRFEDSWETEFIEDNLLAHTNYSMEFSLEIEYGR